MGKDFKAGDRVKVEWSTKDPNAGHEEFAEIKKVNGKSGVIVRKSMLFGGSWLVQIDGWSCELYIPGRFLVAETLGATATG